MRGSAYSLATMLAVAGALTLAPATTDAGPNSRHYRGCSSHGYIAGHSYGHKSYGYRGHGYRYGYISSGGRYSSRYCKPYSRSSVSFGYYGGSYGSGFSVGVSSGYRYGSACGTYSYRSPVYTYKRPSYYDCPPSTTIVNTYPRDRVVYVNNPAQDRVVYVNDTPPASQRVVSDTPAPAAPPAQDGWNLLNINDAQGAKLAFAREADANPNAALPKIGFAVASAMLSQDADAVWAMRRALRTNPESIMYFPRHDALAPALTSAAEHYRAKAQANPSDVDAHFMAAAVSFLREDLYTARMAVNSAIHYGDTDASSYALKNAINLRTE